MDQTSSATPGAGTVITSADILRILKLLPHRYPFLMIDRIVDIQGDDFGIGIKNVTFNEPQFQGHFPAQPIMPGVLLIEGMAQTAGAMCVIAKGWEETPKLVYFMAIDECRFRKPVVPGDRVEFHVKKLKNRGNIWKYFCEAKVDGTRVAEAALTAMIVDGTPEK
ncbi:3-hydroxyacyl-ACP dehydratase FabZ [Segnochrobactraceae bacterium EtOH-i3]